MPSMPTITRQAAAHRADVQDRSSYALLGGGLLVLLLVAVLAVIV